MSSVRQIWEIARRDFLQRAKSRVFLISTVAIVFLVLSVGPLLASATSDDPPQEVGVVGDSREGFEEAARAAAAGFDLEVRFTRLASIEAGEAALENGDVRVVLTADQELVWREEPSRVLTAVLSAAVHSVERNDTIAELGLTPTEAAALLSPPPLTSRSLEVPDPAAEPRRITAMVGSILLYAAILMFGQFVMLGVLEEKSNRVVEVVLSRVQPHQILVGKVLGIGLLGLAQLVILSVSVVFMLNLISINGVNLAGIGVGMFAWIVFWFILGYAFFSVLYATMGALVSRQEDAQSVGLIPVLLMLPGYFFSLIASSDPEVLTVRVLSLIPPMSTMVMPIRASVTEVPVWEIALSILLIVVASYGMIRLGGRVYRGAVLQIGAKVRIRDAWRAADL
ncbi:MAG: ABC transporter permease [Acidimicrobiia bacterium]|nr:ABC transporter permease [Acidimicrobiia bacterium]MDH3398829.1 ABC transporter permease [Acidimicrobiia bacterium]MDH5616598.1 ABC transporter permease [Acidimicrobiia bacterium]